MPYLVRNGHGAFSLEVGEPGRPLLLLLPGSPAWPANHSAQLEHFGPRFSVATRDFLGIATWSVAHVFRRAADELLAGVRVQF